MAQQSIGKFRWVVCALLFFATTINYLDRAVISLLKSYLEKDFNWSETDYSDIVIAFQLAYAIGLLAAGRLIDKVGTKIGYAIPILLWSVAAVSHAFVKTTFGFIVARAGLGITEAGNFPAAIKTVAEWFPKKERALSTGIFNSGANIGAIIAPLTVPFIATNMGWQWAFVFTGAIGFIWFIFWLWFYEIPQKQKRLSKAEFGYIQHDPDEIKNNDGEADKGKISWLVLLRFRQSWAFILGKYLTDPVWWFYLFWLPAFLKAQYGISGTTVSWPVATVYMMSTIGSIWGGWLPLYFINKGWPVYRARKTSMLIYACFAVPVISAQLLGESNMWIAVIIIGIAAAGHQAWSANIFTTVSDMFPKRAVGSVTGIGGMAGAVGGILIAKLAGMIFDHFKGEGNLKAGYSYMFVICAFSYLLAWIIMHLLVPKMKKVEIG